MPETMNAVVKTKPQLGAEWLKKPVPTLKPDWVLVKVGAIPFHVFGTWPHTILAYAVFLLMLAIALGIYDGMEKKP